MSKGIDQLKDWAMHNVRLINILPSNENLSVDTKLIDVLEHDVDEKYFLSDERVEQLKFNDKVQKGDIKQVAQYDTETRLNSNRFRVYATDGISPTLGTMQGGNLEPCTLVGGRIRKLTPKETWRLQGFTDEQFYKAKNDGVSNSQLYKQAGNSVTVNVIDAIARKLI